MRDGPLRPGEIRGTFRRAARTFALPAKTRGGEVALGSEDHVPLFTRYGLTRTGDAAAPLVVEPYAAVCVDGALRATVVASAIDLVGGFVTRALAGSEATFTTDLSLRIPATGGPAAAGGPRRSAATRDAGW